MRVIAQSIQGFALLTGVGERCLTAALTNAVHFPRYPSIASLSRLLATASLVQRVALPEEHNTIGSFLGLVLHGIVEHCETLSCYRGALPKAHRTRWMSFAYPWCS
jgi:hypothetical protein